MDCPICQNLSDRIFQKNGFWIRECKSCHHRYTEITPSGDHPEQIYQDDYFFGGADGYPDYLAEAKILSAHGKRYGNLLKKFTSPGTLLDVGAAAGFILKGFQETGWQGVGVEPNFSMAEYARTQLGIQMITGSLEQLPSGQQFDLVSMIQVVAHFYDLRQALQKAADVTKLGGFWLIETWDRASWAARLFGKNWQEYTPPGVLHWFSPAGIKQLANQFGFVEVARGRPAKYISGMHAKSLFRYSLQAPRLGWLRDMINIIPDQLVIPYPPVDLFWILLQKNKNAGS